MDVIPQNIYTVNYASRRSEIWRWYWRAWVKPGGLWRVHVFFGATCGLIFAVVRNPTHFDVGSFLVAAALFILGFIIFLPLWPQIRFKSAVRSLTISAQGVTTSIGKILGSRLWGDIRSIDEKDDTIVIVGTNKNAFIVPARAFASGSERREFYEAARRWWAQAHDET